MGLLSVQEKWCSPCAFAASSQCVAGSGRWGQLGTTCPFPCVHYIVHRHRREGSGPAVTACVRAGPQCKVQA